MKASIFRAGSVLVIPRVSLPRQGSLAGFFSLSSPIISLHFPMDKRKHLRRALSDSDIIRSEPPHPGGSRCFTAAIPEEEYVSDREVETEFGFSGDKSEMGDYYREMLKLNPGDSLLLRNFGRFLHEVEKNMDGAEEYYGRAILASPGDGEVLCLYGKLIWERHGDQSRAKSYLDRAVTASPDDCMVLGSYAHFLWDAEEDDDEHVGVSRVVAAPAF